LALKIPREFGAADVRSASLILHRTPGRSLYGKSLCEVHRSCPYICHRQYIQPHIMGYRGIITELLHKAPLKTKGGAMIVGVRRSKSFSCTFPNHKLKTLQGFSSLSRLIPGRFAGLREGHRPIDECLHRRTERFPKLGEFIFHLWWKLRMNRSTHQLALLKETQLLRQHTL